MGILGICIGIWAILVVLGNSFLQGMVKQYMMIDLASNLFVNGLLAYVYLALTAIVDFTIFFMLRRRIRAFQSDQRRQTSQQARNLRKEYKLAAQVSKAGIQSIKFDECDA
ncbi:unnamed protein product, partial [Mesorhabditis belari]|uniref:Uncharacterized protein n=1 Tax=Mesorhabditis belari TaxID=2138241 RepID=A0AAF3EPC6_9BILA